MTSTPPARRRDLRWRGALDVLALVRRSPGITRAELARRAHLSSGAAAELAARLRERSLLEEGPAPVTGRGRPTTVLSAHPAGPVVAAVDLRHEDWRLALVGVDGRLQPLASGRHRRRDPATVLAGVGEAIAEAHRRCGPRLRAVSVAVPGTVQHQELMQASALRWGRVDLRALLRRAPGAPRPLLIGNDATLAGVAEARSGRAGGRALLYLHVEVGIGGVLVVDGQPVTGATGAGGEFGHLPFADAALRCPCGARGCWDLAVDGRAMARLLGEPTPGNALTYARAVLARAPRDRAARGAVDACAAALGAGAAALVNALDPDAVALGGLAVPLHAAGTRAFAAAYRRGLMAFRRAAPPPVRAAAHGQDGALHGAAEVGLDALLTEEGLEAWGASIDRRRSALAR